MKDKKNKKKKLSSYVEDFKPSKNKPSVPVLCLPNRPNDTFPFRFGVGKAKLIIKYIKDIEQFIEDYENHEPEEDDEDDED